MEMASDEFEALASELEASMESDGDDRISILPPELLGRCLRFVPHHMLVRSCRRVNKVLCVAADAEASCRTQQRLQDALAIGFASDKRPVAASRCAALASELTTALSEMSHGRSRRL